jgi:hypothetical protein
LVNPTGDPVPAGQPIGRADAEWHALAARFPARRAFLYGTSRRALVDRCDGATDTLSVELAIVDGVLRL